MPLTDVKAGRIARKTLMLMKGVRSADIARDCKCSPSLVSQVISGDKRSRRVEVALARRLRMKVGDLW